MQKIQRGDDDDIDGYKDNLDLMELVQQLIEKRKTRQMDRKALKFIVDVLNLVFGTGDETDYFW